MFDRFRALVLSDPGLQSQLRAQVDWEPFVALACGLSAERGCRVDPRDLEDARVAARRAFIERDLVPRPARDGVRVVGWTPVHFAMDGREPSIEWLDLRGLAFEDPFFEDTVQRALREPYRLLFRPCTTVDPLAEAASCPDSADPAGFIFHTSRCGSTLACRMLATLPDVLVLSEPFPVDQVLRAPGVDAETRCRWLRWVLGALTQRRRPQERHAIVKFDAWSVHSLAVVRHAFPDVPWVFVYRRPEEVVASQLRMPGMHMVPGVLPPELFGMDLATALELPAEEYCARVVAAICEAAAAAVDGRARLVDYAQLPAAVSDELLPHFGLDAGPEDRLAMRDAANADAKNPRMGFDPAAWARDRPVTPAVRVAAERLAGRAHARIEDLRAAQPGVEVGAW